MLELRIQLLKLRIMVLFFIIFFSISFTAKAEINIDSYCQLTIEGLEQQIPQTQELISIVEQYIDNPTELASRLEIKRTEFDQAKADLYASFNTTADEYIAYMNRNAKAVNAYLNANPSVKQQIEELSVQLEVLRDREEALMQEQIQQEDALPPE